MESPKRARSRKRLTQPRGVLHTTAPVPDPTAPKGHDGLETKRGQRTAHRQGFQNCSRRSFIGDQRFSLVLPPVVPVYVHLEHRPVFDNLQSVASRSRRWDLPWA